MRRIVTSYDMMLSSPSDTLEEVNAILSCVSDFNRQSGLLSIIRPRMWKKDVFADSTKKPQSNINEDLVNECDFAVVVFKNRLGTPVGDDVSGTAQEIRLFREQGKQVFIFYMGDGNSVNKDAEPALKDYIESLKKEPIWVKPYSNSSDLANQLFTQLSQYKMLHTSADLQVASNLGIRRMSVGKADDKKLSSKIENASFVKVFFTTGSSFFHAHGEDFVKMLQKGGTLQVLVPNPESEFLRDVELVEERLSKPISEEFKFAMDELRKVWKQATSNHGNLVGKIEVGCCRTLLRQTEIICIDRLENGREHEQNIWCWVTMTMPPKHASGKSLSFECQSSNIDDDSLANWTNLNFDKCWEKTDIKLEYTGQDIPYFYMELSHAKKFWNKLMKEAMDFSKKAQNDKKRNGVLIEVAAQHPLERSGMPGEEFSRRLNMGIELYHRVKAAVGRCKIYVPGSLHMYEGIEDKVSLSTAGKNYLIEKGIPAEDIYGELENLRYRGNDGVYNSADECFVASQIWKDNNFSELYCVCSPVQCMRKTAHYIAFGVYPSIYTCPSPKMFHNYTWEMFETLPYILYKDHYLTPGKSELAEKQRAERKPGVASTHNVND